jgi:hypothetical protein
VRPALAREAVLPDAYPTVSPKDARELLDDARGTLVEGIDPGEVRWTPTAAARMREASSFEVVAREWLDLTKGSWEAKYANLFRHRLERDRRLPLTVIRRLLLRKRRCTERAVVWSSQPFAQHHDQALRKWREIRAGTMADTHMPA